jgi:hypothetical protein
MTRSFIFTPAESTKRYINYAHLLRDKPGLDYGCAMDKRVIPLRPGEGEFVIARPGHGKSAWMAYRARRAAAQLIERGETDKVVLYFSWEQPIEQIEANFQAGPDYTVSDIAWGRADLEMVTEKALSRVDLPIWLGGKSVADENTRGPRMTIGQVFENIRSLKEDFGVTPALICIDYLQIIPVDGKNSRENEVTEATYQLQELSIDCACPYVAGVQAKGSVDGKGIRIPDLGDTWYTSAVDHVASKVFGVMKPAKYKTYLREVADKDGDATPAVINFAGHDHLVDDSLFLVKMVKQRMEKGYGEWALDFNMATMELADRDNVIKLGSPDNWME